MNCIELSDNPFQGVWIVWFAMLAAGCDSIRRRRHHCRSKWAESARTPRCTRCNLCRIVTHCASLCHRCAIGIHWDPLGLSACRFAPPFAMLKWGLPQSVHSERPSRTSQCYWPLAVESQTYFFDFLCRELIQWTCWARSWDSWDRILLGNAGRIRGISVGFHWLHFTKEMLQHVWLNTLFDDWDDTWRHGFVVLTSPCWNGKRCWDGEKM
jgi:hypothetical protein